MRTTWAHVFGGVILSMMDKCAAIAAFRHSRASVVTASIDRVDFREPIYLGDLVVMKASVNFAGRSSMEVGVRVEAEDLLTGRRRHTNSCYLTFVAVDSNGRPIEVPHARAGNGRRIASQCGSPGAAPPSPRGAPGRSSLGAARTTESLGYCSAPNEFRVAPTLNSIMQHVHRRSGQPDAPAGPANR